MPNNFRKIISNKYVKTKLILSNKFIVSMLLSTWYIFGGFGSLILMPYKISYLIYFYFPLGLYEILKILL